MGVATAAVVEGAETAFAKAASDRFIPSRTIWSETDRGRFAAARAYRWGEDGVSLLEQEARVCAQSRGASDRISPSIRAVARPPAPDP
jgi:hypothetical protein